LLQRELLHVIEHAAAEVSQQPVAGYNVKAEDAKPKPARRANANEGGKLTLDELWARARRLGSPMPSESADIVRRDRDARLAAVSDSVLPG
jgi:hypothetical protein